MRPLKPRTLRSPQNSQMPADPDTVPPLRAPSLVGRLLRSENASGWALISPGAILIGVFGLLPVLMSLKLSFQQADLLTPETPWVGTDNYRRLADDPRFAEAIKHTLIYTALFVPGTML